MKLNVVFVGIFALLLSLTPGIGDEDIVNEMLTDPLATGLLVTEVVSGSQAAAAGILPGDIIVKYGDHPTPDIPAMNFAAKEVERDKEVALVVVRRSGNFTFTMAPGRIGVSLVGVVRGERREPLPPDTHVAFDFTTLKLGPQDNWYALYREGQKCGFGRITAKLVGGMIFVITREIIDLDSGLVDHEVTSVVSSHRGPLPIMTTFKDRMNDWVRYGLFGTNDHREPVWTVTGHGPGIDGDDESAVRRLPPDAVPGYVMEILAAYMPRQVGACFRFRPLMEGSGQTGLEAALYGAGEEDIVFDGSTVKAFRFEWRRLQGGNSSVFWVDRDDRMILADYGGLRAVLTTEGEALKGQPASVQARLAR